MALQLMKDVGIPNDEEHINDYPHQWSGGMLHRAVIAIALAADPEILIADEPTTALDVTIQAQILRLMKKIQEERDSSIIFINHDLGVVAGMADRVAVMYAVKLWNMGLWTRFSIIRNTHTHGDFLTLCLQQKQNLVA